MQRLERLGWNAFHQQNYEQFASMEAERRVVARVASVERATLSLLEAPQQRVRGELNAALLEPAVVGDWVIGRRDAEHWLVDAILPRQSCLQRKQAGKSGRAQPIAANVDRVLIVTSAGRDLNPRRLERYLTASLAGGAEPWVVVNKIDQAPDPLALEHELERVLPGVNILLVSALHATGIDALQALAEGRTLALVGSSGVGKSTLTNALTGAQRETRELRALGEKGRHTTSQSDLLLSTRGGLIIDTPGMREFGLLEASGGLDAAFADLIALAADCRFRDCGHGAEPGCALVEALARGELNRARFNSYLALAEEAKRPSTPRQRSLHNKQLARDRTRQIREHLRHRKKNGLKDW